MPTFQHRADGFCPPCTAPHPAPAESFERVQNQAVARPRGDNPVAQAAVGSGRWGSIPAAAPGEGASGGDSSSFRSTAPPKKSGFGGKGSAGGKGTGGRVEHGLEEHSEVRLGRGREVAEHGVFQETLCRVTYLLASVNF